MKEKIVSFVCLFAKRTSWRFRLTRPIHVIQALQRQHLLSDHEVTSLQQHRHLPRPVQKRR